MWPWGHLAVGYLVYSLFSRLQLGSRPQSINVIAVAIGTQFPDFLDKPLSYTFHFLPEGRSLAHSILFILPFCLIVIVAARRYGKYQLGVGFTIGYLTHPLADSYLDILQGNWSKLSFMVYPILPSPNYRAESFGYHADLLTEAINRLSIERILSPWNDHFLIEFWIAFLIALLWAYDGFPPFTRWIPSINWRKSNDYFFDDEQE